MQLCTSGNSKCAGFCDGECRSIENCMYQSNGRLRNGMWDYKLVKPKESKPYLVMFQYASDGDSWFEVIHFQAKCQKWKRLNHLVVGWLELPSKRIQ